MKKQCNFSTWVDLKIAQYLCECVADLQDEAQWQNLFERTQPKLVLAAQQAKSQIAAGQSVPMDYDQL